MLFLSKIKTNLIFFYLLNSGLVKALKKKPHNMVVKKMGMACSYPGTFCGALHAIISSKNLHKRSAEDN